MKQDVQETRASIGRTTRVVGRLTGDGDLLVEGRIEGELSLRGHLEVAEGAVVNAPVESSDLTVDGSVDGDVVVRGAVVLRSTGVLRGAIRAPQVAIEEGARFTGRIEMDVELPAELGGNPAAASEGTRRASGRRG